MTIDTSIEKAYRATAYIIDTPSGRTTLRISQLSPTLDVLMREHNATTWAYITAENPASKHLTHAENASRRADLAARIAAAGWPAYPGVAVADNKDWPDEHGWLIVGIPPADAIALGEKFRQNAILRGELGKPIELRFLRQR